MTHLRPARPESPVERFFLPRPLQLATVELDGSEAHHLMHVLRAQVGNRVGLFNGRGDEALAELTGLGKRSAEMRIIETWTTPAETREVILATALPKGDRARWLMEKATELGVTRLIPLQTVRSVVEPGQGKLDKLEQAAIAACKQCGRSHLPQVDPLTPLAAVLREFAADPPQRITLLADSRAELSLGQLFASLTAPPPMIVALIGPEGGFTDDEVAAASMASATPVRLNSNVLRIETAALAIAAACRLMIETNPTR